MMSSLPMAVPSRVVNTLGVLQKVNTRSTENPQGKENFVVMLLTANCNLIVENEDHCDFKKLRQLLIRTHMLDLISSTEESHYENYRNLQMETRKIGEPKYESFFLVFCFTRDRRRACYYLLETG
jgi:hypothetical protein